MLGEEYEERPDAPEGGFSWSIKKNNNKDGNDSGSPKSPSSGCAEDPNAGAGRLAQYPNCVGMGFPRRVRNVNSQCGNGKRKEMAFLYGY
jgi:hypothetical protein